MLQNKKRIYITENQFNRLIEPIQEGLDWRLDDDDTVNLHINTNRDDKSNVVSRIGADTRVFGTKHDILYGDESFDKARHTRGGGKLTNLVDRSNNYIRKISNYYTIKRWAENGCNGDILRMVNLTDAEKKSVERHLQEGDIVEWCAQTIKRLEFYEEPRSDLQQRLAPLKNDDKTFRFVKGKVPNVGIPYIALFYMKDFNFSDALKNGKVRPGTLINKLTGDNTPVKGKRDVTYDDKVPFNLQNNFSLDDNLSKDHYKKQYGYKGEGGYTSINQFLDKSIMYAARVLKEVGFTPTFIVSAPSSSKFNKYYCTNLSNKLGIEYIEDFFKKNALNVTLNGQGIEQMLNDGFTEKDVLKIQNFIQATAIRQISAAIQKPFYDLMERFAPIFSDRNYENIKYDAYRYIVGMLPSLLDETKTNPYISKHLAKSVLDSMVQNEEYKKSIKVFNTYMTQRIGKKRLNGVIQEMLNIFSQYADVLMSKRGLKVIIEPKDFKITGIDKRYRNYLSDVYIVADEMLTNGELRHKFQNASFLLVDEDVNSGGTLKLIAEALLAKLPETSKNKLLGLVNAYSENGF